MTLSAVPPRRRLAKLLGAVAAILLAPFYTLSASAQDRTVVIGSASSDPVTVDLSVLDAGSGGRAPGVYGDLLFPGSRYKPGQRVILRPPGMVAERPVLRPPGETRPQRRALARRPVSRPSPAAVATRKPAPRPAPVAQRRPPSNTPPPPPRIAMPGPAPAPKRAARTAPPSDAALAAIKPAAGPRTAAPAAKPPLAAPQIKKRASVPAAPQAAIPPVPSPAKPAPAKPARRAPAAAPPSAADIPPPPPMPPVKAAPRVPVTTTPAPAPKSAPAPKTQVASIPRTASMPGRAQQIVFAPGSSKLEGAGQATLAGIAKSLAQDPARRVELRAYARGNDNNVSHARRLSLSRALAVRSALIAQGVKATRIDVRALGNRVPSGIPNRVDLTVFTR